MVNMKKALVTNWHVYPVNDLKPHEVEGDPCPCNPVHQRIDDDKVLVSHNSFDGRELKEVPEERLN